MGTCGILAGADDREPRTTYTSCVDNLSPCFAASSTSAEAGTLGCWRTKSLFVAGFSFCLARAACFSFRAAELTFTSGKALDCSGVIGADLSPVQPETSRPTWGQTSDRAALEARHFVTQLLAARVDRPGVNRTDLAIIDQFDALNASRVVLPLPKLRLELHLLSDGRFGRAWWQAANGTRLWEVKIGEA
jgi:hypothetical protein